VDRTPVNAAQAFIYLKQVEKLKSEHSLAVTGLYLMYPMKLMKMYLEVVQLLSD
jgi:hypothetical protein